MIAPTLAVSMARALGNMGLVTVLVASLFGAVSTIAAISTRHTSKQSAKALARAPIYAWAAFAGGLVATLAMQIALQQRDYSIEYVQRVGSSATPVVYNIAAMWSALEGSILLWVLVLTGYLAAIAWRYRRRVNDRLVAWALAVMMLISAFFGLVSYGPANPFQPGPVQPIGFDGPGPNPILQNHILVLFHPPILYLGYVGFSVSFSFAIAALITGRVGEGWLLETRRWALFAWGFLTIGILLGAWWSYEVLGWSGVWAWDPVENASLIPWLTGTAYLHSVLVQQRRGMLRVWNLSLLVATFSLTILGTFLTRSGVVSSVHSFSAGQVDGYLLGFFGAVVVISLGLIAWRGDRLRAPGNIDSPLSREGAFMANNVLFAVFAFVVLLGTVFPLLVEAIEGRRTVVGAPYFNRLSAPIGMVLLFFMAVAPVLPWRKASEEVLRDRLFWPAWGGVGVLVVALLAGANGWEPLVAFFLAGFAAGSALRQLVLATRHQGWRGLFGRANGGMVVHLGVIIVAVALVASTAYTNTTTLTLNAGETVAWQGHTFEFVDVTESTDARTDVARANIRVDGAKIYGPAMTTYLMMGATVPTPSVRTGLTSDIYLTLAQNTPPTSGANKVTLQIFIKPLVVWLWIGGLIMAIGTVLAAFPGRRRNPLDPTSAATAGTTSTTNARLSAESGVTTSVSGADTLETSDTDSGTRTDSDTGTERDTAHV